MFRKLLRYLWMRGWEKAQHKARFPMRILRGDTVVINGVSYVAWEARTFATPIELTEYFDR